MPNYFKSIYPEQKTGYFLLAILFFNVGFFASINGVLVAYFKESLNLSYFIANIIPFVFFLAYFLMSAPFGLVLHKYGYRKSINTGLILGVIGCLLFIVGVYAENFLLILLALFFIASFVTSLEVAANPLVDSMGPASSSSQRLTFVHFLDSVGTIIGPQFAAFIFLFSLSRQQLNYRITFFYLLLGIVFIVFIQIINRVFHDQAIKDNSEESIKIVSLWRHSRLILGVIAIFIYVGCEVSIANFLISFAMLKETANLSIKVATIYLSLYWCGQMIGRLIATVFMGKIRTYFLLACCGMLAIILLSVALLLHNYISLYLVTLVGLANSIMYPSIFSLAVKNLGSLKSKGSGLLHTGVVGGAIIPLVQGIIADHTGVLASYWLPAALYSFIVFYAVWDKVNSIK